MREGWPAGADGILLRHPSSPHTLAPAQASYSLIGQEDTDVLLQTKKVGQVHGRGQVPRGVNKLDKGQGEMSLELAGQACPSHRLSHDTLARQRTYPLDPSSLQGPFLHILGSEAA